MDELSGRVKVAWDDFTKDVKDELNELKLTQGRLSKQIGSLEVGKTELESSCRELETQLKISQEEASTQKDALAEVKASFADVKKQSTALKGAIDDILHQHNALVAKTKAQETLVIVSSDKDRETDALPQASNIGDAKPVAEPFKKPAPRKSSGIKAKELDWLKAQQQKLQPVVRQPFQRASSAMSSVTLGRGDEFDYHRDSPRVAIAAYEIRSSSDIAELSDENLPDGLFEPKNKRKRATSASTSKSGGDDSEEAPAIGGKRRKSKTDEHAAPFSHPPSSAPGQADGGEATAQGHAEGTENTITVTRPQDGVDALDSADKNGTTSPASTTTSTLFRDVDSVLKAVYGEDTSIRALQPIDANIEKPAPARLGPPTPSPRIRLDTSSTAENNVADRKNIELEKPANTMTRSQILTQFQPRTDAMQRCVHSPDKENVAFDRSGGRLRRQPKKRALREDEMDSRMLTRRETGGSVRLRIHSQTD